MEQCKAEGLIGFSCRLTPDGCVGDVQINADMTSDLFPMEKINSLLSIGGMIDGCERESDVWNKIDIAILKLVKEIDEIKNTLIIVE